MYFEALASGGGDDWYNVILLTVTNGVTVTVSDGDEEIEIVGTGLQQAVTIHNENATYTISATMNGLTKSASSITTDSTSGKLFIREIKMAAIEVTFDDDFRGLDYTISDGTTTSTTQTFPGAPDNTVNIFVPNTGVWKVSSTVGSDTFESQGANVTDLDGSYTDDIHVIPDGKTVTPVNDIQLWLACANIKNKPYTKLEEVLADENTLRKLLTDDNAIDYLKRSKEWIASVGQVPEMTDNTHPSGEAFGEQTGISTDNAYKAFAYPSEINKQVAGWFGMRTTFNNNAVGYEFTSPKKIKYVKYAYNTTNARTLNFECKIQAYDGSNWIDLASFSLTESNSLKTINLTNDTSYSKYRFLIVSGTYNDSTDYGLHLQFYNFETGITDDELAMSYIGAYDYAADTLLSDADWTEGICGSEYMNLVLNSAIPKMTDYNAPSGLVTKSSEYGANYKAWHIFDRDTSTTWASSGGSSGWVAYDFGSTSAGKKFINACIRFAGSSSNLYKFKIQGSDDNFVSDINDLCSEQSVTPSATEGYNVLLNTSKSYRCYRLWQTSTNAYDVTELELRGREAAGVQTLLKLVGIDRPYTTTDELFNDDEALAAVISSHAAIDYLVDAKSFIDAFTSNAKAMRYIGKRNYASDTLLADDDWCEGVGNSEYIDSVLNVKVPAMTSATTPEGTVTESGHYANYAGWKVFDGIIDTSSMWNDYVKNPAWVAYQFTKRVKVFLATIIDNRSNGVTQYKIQGSNDNFVSDINDLYIGTNWVSGGSMSAILTNVGEYDSYRLLLSLTGEQNIYELQFYGREDVDETILDIYSAASDSNIHLIQGGSPVNVGSTDTTGHGTISRSVLPNGEYELYSSVAKDPDNLSNDYHKTVKVTDDTIEINLMPEGSLYWYGFEDDTYGELTLGAWNSEGSTTSSEGTPTNLTMVKNTRDVTLTEPQTSGAYCGLAYYPKPISSKDSKIIKCIIKEASISHPSYAYQGNDIRVTGPLGAGYKAYGYTELAQLHGAGTDTIQDVVRRLNLMTNENIESYFAFYSRNNGLIKFNSVSLLRKSKIANFFGAANDTVYYTVGGTDIVVAETNELGEAVVDLSSIPSGVTLKSSVAKDPDNLSNDFTKIFTMPLTEKFYFMPDNALYWYGWMSDECEAMSTVNGWAAQSGFTFGTFRCFNNYIELSTGSSKVNGVGGSKKHSMSKLNAIVDGVTAQSGEYGYLGMNTSKVNYPNVGLEAVTASGLSKVVLAGSNDVYPYVYSANGKSIKLNAFWYEE